MTDRNVVSAAQPFIKLAMQPEQRPWGRLASMATVGSMALGLAACNPISGEGSSSQAVPTSVGTISVYSLDQATQKRIADVNHNPSFRATTVAVLSDRKLIASGALVKSANGTYELATAEHVVRSIYGLAPRLPKEKRTAKSSEADMYVPGIGSLDITAARPVYSGSARTNDDRYTVVPLNKTDQQILRQAEARHQIAIPKTAQLATQFGGILTMPLADTGKQIPFVSLSDNSDARGGTSHDIELVPLYILNRSLNYNIGMQTLLAAARRLQKIDTKKYPGSHLSLADESVAAVSQLQADLLRQVIAGKVASAEAAKYLDCYSDSGAPFLNRAGQIVGVLSAGDDFSLTDSDKGINYTIDREGVHDAGRACLSTAFIAPSQS